MAKSSDSTFLADALAPRRGKATVTYLDGFRFGFGATLGVLFVLLLVGVVAWGLVLALHLH